MATRLADAGAASAARVVTLRLFTRFILNFACDSSLGVGIETTHAHVTDVVAATATRARRIDRQLNVLLRLLLDFFFSLSGGDDVLKGVDGSRGGGFSLLKLSNWILRLL